MSRSSSIISTDSGLHRPSGSQNVKPQGPGASRKPFRNDTGTLIPKDPGSSLPGDNSEMGESISENSQTIQIKKKNLTISAKQLTIEHGADSRYWGWERDNDSKFSEVAVLHEVCWLEILGGTHSRHLSTQTTYEVYLIYKLRSGATGLREPHYQKATIKLHGRVTEPEQIIYLDSDEREEYPGRQGWSQIKLGEFYNGVPEIGPVSVRLCGDEGLYWKRGLIIEGIEFRAK